MQIGNIVVQPCKKVRGRLLVGYSTAQIPVELPVTLVMGARPGKTLVVSGGVHGHNRLMGNSLLEITVFGRRAGRSAALYAHGIELGRPNLEHVALWNKELEEAGIETDVVSPILLPDYVRRESL